MKKAIKILFNLLTLLCLLLAVVEPKTLTDLGVPADRQIQFFAVAGLFVRAQAILTGFLKTKGIISSQ